MHPLYSFYVWLLLLFLNEPLLFIAGECSTDLTNFEVSPLHSTKPVDLNVTAKVPNVDLFPTTGAKRRIRRQAVAGPVPDLDREIAEVIGSLPTVIDTAIAVQEASLRFYVFKRHSQGWSIVVASWIDAYSDVVINNRTLSNLGGLSNVYKYGFLIFYGIGFGFPYLLNLPSPVLDCGSADFQDVLNQYNLTNGLRNLLSLNADVTFIQDMITEFDSIVRARLNCIIQYGEASPEVSEVTFHLDRLRTLLDLRLEAEQTIRQRKK